MTKIGNLSNSIKLGLQLLKTSESLKGSHAQICSKNGSKIVWTNLVQKMVSNEFLSLWLSLLISNVVVPHQNGLLQNFVAVTKS